ncbi:MAG: ATP-grasp domain-containing protein [Gemmatimonadota bacterium]|nr:ATP-grasp domain-containing protein [Gemmatimonadota bacterium]
MTRSTTLLALASYFKGQEFLREAKRLGARVLLITREKLANAAWPMESIDERFLMPDLRLRDDVIHAVSYLARTEAIDRIVALDEFDLETASTLREHLRIPGIGETTMRYFRDKLAMRTQARERGILVPEFVPILNRDRISEFLDRVPPPCIFKPRLSASAIGIKKVHEANEVWRLIDELGDKQSYHLLEQFIEGDVFHVDAVAWERDVVFAEAQGYLRPPFEVYHGGGLFCTRTLDRDAAETRELKDVNRAVTQTLGMVRGVLHTEFIRGRNDGRIYFLETAARVGGAYIAETVEAATGVNLWREWARVELADAMKTNYTVVPSRQDFAGVIVSLARQEWPDTSAYVDPEIVWRLKKRHHVGLIVASPDRQRVEELLGSYVRRFGEEFHAAMPAAEEASE